MKAKHEVLVEVNGKKVMATVIVDMPGITTDDYFNTDMLLRAVASGQKTFSYVSRHNPKKTVLCTRLPLKEENVIRQPLRLVA